MTDLVLVLVLLGCSVISFIVGLVVADGVWDWWHDRRGSLPRSPHTWDEPEPAVDWTAFNPPRATWVRDPATGHVVSVPPAPVIPITAFKFADALELAMAASRLERKT